MLEDHNLDYNYLAAFAINLTKYLLFESHRMYGNIRTNIYHLNTTTEL